MFVCLFGPLCMQTTSSSPPSETWKHYLYLQDEIKGGIMLGLQCQAGPLNWCSLPLIGGSLFTKQWVLLPFNLPFTNKIEVGFHIKLSKPIIQTWLTLNVNWLWIKLFQLVGGKQKRGSNKLYFKFVLQLTEFSRLYSRDIQKNYSFW